ncbi:MAG: nucleotidyltransferase family protein [Myxococcota bacterium]|nr:nucleotidyltransferase family protein [Myxococcota bacterium]
MPPAANVRAWVAQEAGIQILREVASRCAEAGIPLLPVKGIVTSRLLYADVAERPITDVDIRIRARDLPRFRNAAASAGWPCSRVARTYRNLTYEFGLLSLDVEACVGPPGLCAMEIEAMLDRSERCEIEPGVMVSIPEVHDHAVVLTVNAFKDKIVTATPWALADLERIVMHPTFRCDDFVDRVCQSRITTLTWIVAEWMASSRGIGAWGVVRAAVEARGHVRWGYAKLFRRLMVDEDSAQMPLRLLARVAADSGGMQLEAIVRAAAWTGEMWLREGRGRSH